LEQPVFPTGILNGDSVDCFDRRGSVRDCTLRGANRRAAKWVGVYNVVLLFLYFFGVSTQMSFEGFGFFPLMALTLPWSAPAIWFANHTDLFQVRSFLSGLDATFLSIFAMFNVFAGSINSCILYLLLKRRERKRAAEARYWSSESVNLTTAMAIHQKGVNYTH
jgi:hypothetical protein